MIRKRQTKSGPRWDVRLERPDKTEYCKSFKSYKEAKQYEASEKNAKGTGHWVDPRTGTILFQQWSKEWIESRKQLWRPKTLDKHENALQAHWLPTLGTAKLAAITPRTIQKIINLMSNEYAATTIHTYYATLRLLMADAVSLEIILRSPCKGIHLPPNQPSTKNIVKPRQLHQLADAIGPRWRCAILLAGIMGLRFGEVMALQLKDIDLETNRLRINKTLVESKGKLILGQPKTKQSIRHLAIPKTLTEELRRHLRDFEINDPNQHIFTASEGGLVRASNFRNRALKPALEQTGLEGLTFHGLRHSAATQWIAAGIDIKSVQHQLGHTDPRLTLKLYAHHTNDLDEQTSTIIDQIYWKTT